MGVMVAEKSCRINVYTSADKIAWHHASFSFLQNRKFLIKLFHSVTVLTLPRRVLVFGKGEPYFPLKSPVPTSITVKAGQAYPPRFYYSCSRNWCQIQSGISACVMSREYFTRTSLYLVRLKMFEWVKFLRRHLHQIQKNGAGRNFITTVPRVWIHSSLHMQEYGDQSEIYNLQRIQLSNNKFINGFFRGVRLTWFDCKG